MLRNTGTGLLMSVAKWLRYALSHTTITVKALLIKETTADRITNIIDGPVGESNQSILRSNRNFLDRRTIETRPNRFQLGEKVLCFTENGEYWPAKNSWNSPNDVFLARVINYNKRTKIYTVRITDWPKGQYGTKAELKESQLLSWEHHVPGLKEWGL